MLKRLERVAGLACDPRGVVERDPEAQVLQPEDKHLPALEDAFQASVERGSYVGADLHQLLSALYALPLLAREPAKTLRGLRRIRYDKRTVRIRR